MKLIKLLSFVSLLMALVCIMSCVEDENFELPDITIVDPTITPNMTFNNVVSRYKQAVENGNPVAIFDEDQDLYLEGYVISNDKAGNFFEELIIQNKIDGSSDATDPRLGFKVEVNVSSLSDTYEAGRKIYIKMNGLAIGISNGVYAIGKQSGNNIEQIQDYEYRDFIIRGPEVLTVTPKITTIGELTEKDENTLIQLNNVQIHRNELTTTFAGEPSDEYDGFRTLESCDENTRILLQTSTFADFKSLPVPKNKGSIQGIYSRDFGDDLNVLIINSSLDVNFDNIERCDPVILECTEPTSDSIIIFNEDFQSINNESDLDALGWTNTNISGGRERYEENSDNGDTYMKVSAFGTGESPLEAWLITPPINLDGTSQEELSFDIAASFNSGQVLTAFISNNYTGDPNSTEWTQLDVEIPLAGSGYGNFVTLTTNISCLSGEVHVAFQYLGSAGGAETRYHIDDIKITGSN